MTVVLGIDTGGTYTDSVILQRDTKEIIDFAKSQTIHTNLMEGIHNAIGKLNRNNIDAIEYVALSTTLATNAIVENKGCRVGLMLLGYELENKLPSCLHQLITGSIDITGEETVPLDENAVAHTAELFRDKVDAITISGFLSIRNPIHEIRAKEIVKKILPVPVVMAHELSSTLGLPMRTNTAVLNAKLLSVIDDLICAVKDSLKEYHIEAPLMIVKGDGSLMTEQVARERPIETILSGPAASIIGATYLNDNDHCLVVDMGGTTTDIAIINNGKPILNKEGAVVGGWRTRVSAINAYTFGIGGDSCFSRNPVGDVWSVGPLRCNPVSMIAAKYPYYKEEIFSLRGKHISIYHRFQTDGLILLHTPEFGMELSAPQKKLIHILSKGPHTFVALNDMLETNTSHLGIEALIECGILGIVGFSPTDILCAQGKYCEGDRETAVVVAEIIAGEYGFDINSFYQFCISMIEEKVCRSLLTCVLDQSDQCTEGNALSEYYFRNAIGKEQKKHLDVSFKIPMDIIGIGAPIGAWLSTPAEKMGVSPIISPYHEVANAIGAAAGKVMTIYPIYVMKQYDNISVHTPWEKWNEYPAEDSDIEDIAENVIKKAIATAKEKLCKNMAEQNVTDFEILTERKDIATTDSQNNITMFLESKIDVIAVGHPFGSD